MAAACHSDRNTLTDRPSTVDSQRFVPTRTRSAGSDPARPGEKLADDHRAAPGAVFQSRSTVPGERAWCLAIECRLAGALARSVSGGRRTRPPRRARRRRRVRAAGGRHTSRAGRRRALRRPAPATGSPAQRGIRQLRRIRPRPAPIAALTTAANTRQSVRSLLRARRPFAVSSYARRRRSGPIRGGDPHGRPCCEVIPLRRRRESARMLGSEREWVRRPEVAQHRHVMLVLDVDCHLMDLERNFQSATFCSARRRRARASAWSAH